MAMSQEEYDALVRALFLKAPYVGPHMTVLLRLRTANESRVLSLLSLIKKEVRREAL